MYTTTGERLTWKEFNNRRANGEKIFIGEYPKKDKEAFKAFAHSHTKKETEEWLDANDMSLDIMYTKGRPDCYDKWSGESAGIRCTDGYLWN